MSRPDRQVDPEQLYRRVKEEMIRKNMAGQGESVVAGVSGGADSVCLLLLLRRISEEMGFFLHAVHVHHGLRDSAEGDLAFVEELCGSLEVPLTIVRADAGGLAKRMGIGVEEAGRRIRYEAFGRQKRILERERGAVCRIAVAHHREDQAETVLFRLCRGTDLRGAAGMLPVSGSVIRPLLLESRASIEEYLRGQETAWREDETNGDISYARNYLRSEILPRLSEGVHAAASARIAAFAGACAEAEQYLTARTEEAFARCLLSRPECITLDLAALEQEDPYLRGRVLFCALAASAGSRRNIGSVHIEALKGLCGEKGGGQLSMPGGILAVREGGRICFRKKERSPYAAALPEKGGGGRQKAAWPLSGELKVCQNLSEDGMGETARPLSGEEKVCQNPAENGMGETARPLSGEEKVCENPAENGMGETARPLSGEKKVCQNPAENGMGETAWPLSREEYACRIFKFDGNLGAIPQKTYTKWFDYDKIGLVIMFRTRLPGDRMGVIRDAEGEAVLSKKLARVMLDAKVPQKVRSAVVLPFAGAEALWFPGVRMGDSFRVTPRTRRILEIRWIPGEE